MSDKLTETGVFNAWRLSAAETGKQQSRETIHEITRNLVSAISCDFVDRASREFQIQHTRQAATRCGQASSSDQRTLARRRQDLPARA